MKFVNCQGCEQRRKWLHDRAKQSISSIQRAIEALSSVGTKQPDPEAKQPTDRKPKRTDQSDKAVSADQH